jgi:hypothetical protein
MHIPQSLQTIAEISIAFAGFSGLIVALRKKVGPLTEIEKYRLQILLTLAFGAMFLSFLPEVLESLGIGEHDTWVYAGSALFVYSAIFLVWWIYASRRFVRAFPEIFHWSAFFRMAAGHVAVMLLQVSAIFSLVVDKGAAVFVIALVWYLVHAAQQFARMLFVQPIIADSDTS